MMECADVRDRLLSARRGTLVEDEAAEVAAHLRTCDACRAIDAADSALSSALERMPAHRAPSALRAKIASRLEGKRVEAPPVRIVPARRARLFPFAASLAAAAVTILVFFAVRTRARDPIVTEAVADHLRVLYADHPIEVVSTDMHTVKPWFAGRLDFAPTTAFLGDADFPLEGGAVAYFLDRKAAALLFTRRLHRISVFVFPAGDLSLPSTPTSVARNGFHVVTFRNGDLGYALVSDVSEADLLELSRKIIGS